MTISTQLTVVQSYFVSPPRSVAATFSPLTFFDVPWLTFPPTQPLFFYDFPTTTAYFTENVLPNLKCSLSHTLQHFFPLAGNLVIPPHCTEPHLEYVQNDSISLTISEAALGDFKNLTGNHSKIALDFHGLVHVLPIDSSSRIPLLSIQITVFPECGICIGFNLRNVVADGRTFDNFLKTWASISKNGEIQDVDHVAIHDRSVIKDPIGLKSVMLKEWRQIENSLKEMFNGSISYDRVRATFVMGRPEMEEIKKWILDRSKKLFGSTQLFISPYVVTCAYVWVCWMKTHWPVVNNYGENILHYFGFIAGGITRLYYPVPDTYVGNCVSFGRSKAMRSDLIGENGILHAAKAIGDTIKMLNEDVLGGVENWIREWKELHKSELHVTITGSPKLSSYELDFGWGQPVKIEEMSVDKTRSIFLCESRDGVGGMEIGVALPKSKMNVFSALFSKGPN